MATRETGRLESTVLKPKPAVFRDCTGRQVDRGKATEPSPGLKEQRRSKVHEAQFTFG